MKNFFKFITSRMFFIGLIFLFQIALVYEAYVILRDKFFLFYVLNLILGIILAIHIINKDTNPAYKIAWLIPIFVFPVFGSIIYLFFAQNRFVANIRMSMATTVSSFHYLMSKHENILDEISNVDSYMQSRYIERYANFPVYKNTKPTYFPTGEDFFQELLKDLKNAKKFIFLEFFIIEEGYMWESILEILEEKAKSGVDVSLIYDDFGCMSKLPRKYDNFLRSKGIKCCVFNPIKLIVMPKHNNRDHRKIVVIDGTIGYTGGANLADEYINKIEKFGRWKDSAVKLYGQAVWSLTIMFLAMWNSLTDDDLVFEDYLLEVDDHLLIDRKENGYIQPFSDTPLDSEPTGEVVYLNIINKAKDYIYITTPYLVLSNEILMSLCNAAKCGIDVRILTPHIPDKKSVFYVTRSYYEQLLSAGVKIYEYTPGFMHAKNVVTDDNIAVVGTINVDFRSLYLHFEDAVWFYNSSIVNDVKKDFLETIKISEQQTLHKVKNTSFIKKLIMSVLKVFAPIM
ncbi:cardiolipin synthase [Miniphocaeibacter massiliensis]|uniref:cardiolipin synthase n=1 Tax=Miniphocaeibacter massiliensis TaxID=2041841 RepID=UPI000C1C8361|nr:cardiolipin synthase [Miniphocaeibacter massiliensis]